MKTRSQSQYERSASHQPILQTRIPTEVLQRIFSWIHPSEVLKFTRCCRHFYDAMLCHKTFVTMCLANFIEVNEPCKTESYRPDDFDRLWLVWPKCFQAAYTQLKLVPLTTLRWKEMFGSLNTPIPSSVGMLSNLKLLNLFGNRLSSSLPEELWCLSGLQQLVLRNNQLSGEISPAIGNLRSLQHLDLGMNNFDGEIPATLGNLLSLKYLNLGWNDFESAIPCELGNLASLKVLTLSGNTGISGPIPQSLNQLTNLERLDLSDCDLTGSIPDFSNLIHLHLLNLSRNRISGTMPVCLSNLTSLRGCHLNENLLSGKIPPEFGQFSHLNTLDLTGNCLEGGLPPTLGDLHGLIVLRLGSNHFTGLIPEFSELVHLRELDLRNNRFFGSIPATLWSLHCLSEVNLEGNCLSGKVSDSIAELKSLALLKVSGNLGLERRIPESVVAGSCVWRLLRKEGFTPSGIA